MWGIHLINRCEKPGNFKLGLNLMRVFPAGWDWLNAGVLRLPCGRFVNAGEYHNFVENAGVSRIIREG